MQFQTTPGRTYELLKRYSALSRDPGNLDLIRDQLDFLREEPGKGSAGSGAQGIDDLVALLTSQAAFVKEEDLGTLAELLDEIIREQATQTDVHTCGEGEDEGLRKRLAQFRASLPAYDLSGNTKELRIRLDEASELRDFALELGGSVNDLDHHISQVQTSLQILTLADEFQANYKAAKGAKDHSASAYLLQQCEAIVRQALTLEVSLGSKSKGTGERLLGKLKAESIRLRDRTQKAESQEIWADFDREYSIWFKRIKGVDLTTTGRTIKVHLDDLNWAMKSIQQVLGKLTHSHFITLALKELEELHALHAKATETQYKRYNKMALDKIMGAYAHGLEHVGKIRDDKNKIGEALIKWLGPIDSRYLATEVQRCYGEVFEYLFARLDKPSDKDSFEAETNKLYVLKQLMDNPKLMLSDL